MDRAGTVYNFPCIVDISKKETKTHVIAGSAVFFILFYIGDHVWPAVAEGKGESGSS